MSPHRGFLPTIYTYFEAEDMQFGQYSKSYNCIPLPIILESKTKMGLVDKIKSLKNKLYLITCETLEKSNNSENAEKVHAEKCQFSQSTNNDEPLPYVCFLCTRRRKL